MRAIQRRVTSIVLTTVFGAAFYGATALQPSLQGCCGGNEAKAQSEPKPVIAKEVNGVQKVTVAIDGGYSPSAIEVKKGMPVEMTFKRVEKQGCGGTVVFKSLKIRKEIASGKSAVIKFTPKEAGEIPFTCGMGMFKGKVIVK